MASVRSSISDVFRQLQDPQSKIKALDELADSLTHDQIRFLQAKISTVDFRCDPIDKLPSEVWHLIFQHLEAYQIFQAQRVSRQWHQSLSSPRVVEALILRPWFGNSEGSSRTSNGFLRGALNPPSGLSPSGELSLQARHIDSFRNGTAFSMVKGLWQTRATTLDVLLRFGFGGTFLAWSDRLTDCIQLKCLISDQGASLFTPMREKAHQVACSDTTVVAITTCGKCYAWDVSGGVKNLSISPPECIETHIGILSKVSVSRETFAAAFFDGDRTVNFITWDIKGRQSHRFRLRNHPPAQYSSYTCFMIVTSDGQSIVFFERIFSNSNYISFTRINLKGQIQASGCMEHPDVNGYRGHRVGAASSYATNSVGLWSYTRYRATQDAQQSKANTLETLQVVYDWKLDRLELERHTLERAIQKKLNAGDFFWWKDVAYLENYVNGLYELEVIDLKASICKKTEMSVPDILDLDDEDHERDGKHQSILLGNESFLVSVRRGYYIVWCFENIKTAGDNRNSRAMMTSKK